MPAPHGRPTKGTALLSALAGVVETLTPLPGSINALLSVDLKALDLLEKVQAIIEQDPALAAHVVHVANSAAFAGRDPIAALGPAIKRIGAALVVGNAIQSVVNGIFDPYGGMGRRLGQIAVLEANIMAALATTWESRLHIPPEVAYAHGLLHDLGHLVMALKLGKDLDAFELRQIPPSELAQREIETFGFDHQQAGRLLANHWKLPDELTVVIASHHYPRELRVGQHDSTNATIDLLLITDRLSRLMVQNVERRAAMEAAIAEWLRTPEALHLLLPLGGSPEEVLHAVPLALAWRERDERMATSK